MTGTIEKQAIPKEETVGNVVFLTQQYIKLLRVLFYFEVMSGPVTPVLRLLERNVAARKDLAQYFHNSLHREMIEENMRWKQKRLS
jgi:hypothetical protein